MTTLSFQSYAIFKFRMYNKKMNFNCVDGLFRLSKAFASICAWILGYAVVESYFKQSPSDPD